ncbi:MAG: carbon starvation protein A [Planctomycetes bacterium]|jgi:carbon starvation protein|nr:carbon starvation protein A [Planctomycetota bacterium]
MILGLVLGGVACFAVAYVLYGRFLERRLQVDGSRITPARELEDGVDYVPSPTPVLFGHHFSSIAGAGPIVGPVIAALAFGWGPAILWIVLGAIFLGGVHDFTALVASIRHKARSVGQMCRDLLSPFSYRTFLVFIWLAMVYIQIVFLDLTASTFAPVASDAAAANEGAALELREGGAVATASLLYILLAVLFGLTIYRLKLRLLTGTFVFVPLVFAALWLGHRFPLSADLLPAFLGSPKNTWLLVLLGYCLLASILPVWILLQPRDYLSSFLLYACVGGGLIGLVATGIGGGATLSWPAFRGLSDPSLGFIFPALFITIACGAISGFHSIVASGTTAKQLRSEKSARPVAYGAMLVEGMLGLLALAAVMALVEKPAGRTPVQIFGDGLGRFLSSLHLPHDLAVTFALLAVSTFLLTTLDTCTRLGRFIFEELFNVRGGVARLLGTGATLAIPAVMVFQRLEGPGGQPLPAWLAIWPAFGATNQLLAALSLIVVYAWLRKSGKRAWFVFLPMVFMTVTTLTALVQLVVQNLLRDGSMLVGILSLVLVVLAVVVVADSLRVLLRPRATGAVAAAREAMLADAEGREP